MKRGLNAFELKIIAVVVMVIDHLAYIVEMLPIRYEILSPLLFVMNSVGRLTIPIMCFFIAEGYYHTRDLKKYLLRLLAFAAISQIPFYIFEHGLSISIGNLLHFNVIFSLFSGLLALTVWKSERVNIILKIICAAFLTYITKFSDWRCFAVLWILAFGIFRDCFKKQAVAFIVLSIMRVSVYYILPSFPNIELRSAILQSMTVIALVPLYFYNGRLGRKSKYGFYIFYPAHLLALAAVKFLIS